MSTMYIREVKTRNKKTGVEYSTFRLVKNIRVDGLPKQVNLISLGKLEGFSSIGLQQLSNRISEIYTHSILLFKPDIPAKIEELAHFYTKKLVQKDFAEKKVESTNHQEYPKEKHFEEIDINSITGKSSEQIGGEFLCQQVMQELGIDRFLKEELNYTDSQLNNCLIALTGRLLFSTSEKQTAKWLNDNSAIDELYPLKSAKVNKNQLYSAANQLYKDKSSILDLILSDLSKLGTNLFNEKKPCIIMDAGIATEDNIKLLLRQGYEYICVSRSGHKDLIHKVE